MCVCVCNKNVFVCVRRGLLFFALKAKRGLLELVLHTTCPVQPVSFELLPIIAFEHLGKILAPGKNVFLEIFHKFRVASNHLTVVLFICS